MFPDKKEYVGAVLMDLLVALDTINNGLFIAKLNTYGLSVTALKLLRQ